MIVDDTGAIQTIQMLLSEAWKARASDLHLEPRAQSMRVRYRIDGLLHDRRQLTGAVVSAVSNRLKVLGGLDIAEKRVA